MLFNTGKYDYPLSSKHLTLRLRVVKFSLQVVPAIQPSALCKTIRLISLIPS